jgi:hypothetical protein
MIGNKFWVTLTLGPQDPSHHDNHLWHSKARTTRVGQHHKLLQPRALASGQQGKQAMRERCQQKVVDSKLSAAAVIQVQTRIPGTARPGPPCWSTQEAVTAKGPGPMVYRP